MKIAVADEHGYVSGHFGHCPAYTLYNIGENNKINEKLTIPTPGHQPGFLPGYLASMGVTHIIAGGMGQRAQMMFGQNNIVALTGVSGPVNKAVEDFLAGRLEIGESTCDHGHGHGDGYGHGDCNGEGRVCHE